MRSVLALGLLITLCASANAATVLRFVVMPQRLHIDQTCRASGPLLTSNPSGIARAARAGVMP